MSLTVVASTLSYFARKVRLNLLEQGEPFDLQIEVPWNKDTKTPMFNPLEKLPILIVADKNGDISRPVKIVYESKVILDYLNTVAFPSKSLLPVDAEARVDAKQIEALADGICDAVMIGYFESRRPEEKQSKEWYQRQVRKVEGGLKALDEIVRERAKNGFIVGGELSIADLSVGSLLGFISVGIPEHHWKKSYPNLEQYWQSLEERESFKETVPEMFETKDPVV